MPTSNRLSTIISIIDYEPSLYLRRSVVETVRIDSSGTVHIAENLVAQGSVTGLSDRRWKKNIEPVDEALDKVMQLRGVNFYWKQDDDRNFSPTRQLGFVAQELETIVPEAVLTGEDGQKSVAYSNMTANLVETMKQQQAQFEQQEALKAEIDRLKAQP